MFTHSFNSQSIFLFTISGILLLCSKHLDAWVKLLFVKLVSIVSIPKVIKLLKVLISRLTTSFLFL